MADNDLQALIARLKELPAGVTLTVLIPRGQIAAIGAFLVQENETYHIPGALFVAPALPAPPPAADDTAPQQERFMVAAATLNIRQAPDRNAVLLGTLATGERVAVTGAAVNGYMKLSSREGYVLVSGLTTIT